MMLCDLHTHTVFSDGKNTPEEMVVAAIERGMDKLGFSDHAHTPADDAEYSMKKENIAAYCETIHALKEKYRDKIEILCGIEQDLYSDVPTDGYDYVIGSVHGFQFDGIPYDVDHTEEALVNLTNRFFGGDFLRMAEAYFENVKRLADMKPDIIGHIDLLTKFNEGDKYFNTHDPRYLAAAFDAIDTLLPLGAAFEINTGAISRKRRTSPYPSDEILRYIVSHGGRVIFSSDAHSAETLCYRFEKWQDYYRQEGIL